MDTHPAKELPIRSRYAMLQDVSKAVLSFYKGEKKEMEHTLQDLKARSIFLDPQIQQDVLSFCEQMEFQFAYDPQHSVTKEIQKAADKLIKDLGFTNRLK